MFCLDFFGNCSFYYFIVIDANVMRVFAFL